MTLCLLGVGCGGPGVPETPAGVTGAPRWRISDQGGPGLSGLQLQAGSPVRIRLRIESTHSPADAEPWRTLAAGQTVRAWFGYAGIARSDVEDRPPPEAKAEGRTEALAGTVTCHFEDRVSSVRRLVFWARPGRGHLAHLLALPPGRYEDLPAKASIELVTVVMSDQQSGSARLKRREFSTRVLLPETTVPGDRSEIVRVFLDLAPVEGE